MFSFDRGFHLLAHNRKVNLSIKIPFSPSCSPPFDLSSLTWSNRREFRDVIVSSSSSCRTISSFFLPFAKIIFFSKSKTGGKNIFWATLEFFFFLSFVGSPHHELFLSSDRNLDERNFLDPILASLSKVAPIDNAESSAACVICLSFEVKGFNPDATHESNTTLD